jgi:hypothetical protein
MQNHGMELDPLSDDPRIAEIVARQQQRLSNLQYIVALLLEKNQQMREQLNARTSEDLLQATRRD